MMLAQRRRAALGVLPVAWLVAITLPYLYNGALAFARRG